MRPRPDDALVRPATAAGEGRRPADPIRSCILTRERAAPAALVRLALAPDGQVLPDVRARAPGRGAWIGVSRPELEEAHRKGRLRGQLARAFRTTALTIPDDLAGRIEAALERAALDRLGLEARAGTLLTGTDRIEGAARAGQLAALFHAADARDDGRGKLAQAWRVGEGREGSGLKGLALPVGRTILGLALGRENVVHVGLTDKAAAKRVGEALGRWLHFIGHHPVSAQGDTLQGSGASPCESPSQGASAPPPMRADGRDDKFEDFE